MPRFPWHVLVGGVLVGLLTAMAARVAGGSLPMLPMVLPPACTEHAAIVAVAHPDSVSAYDLKTGRRLWTTTVNGLTTEAGGVLVSGGFAHVPARDADTCGLTVLRPDTGAVRGRLSGAKGATDSEAAATRETILLASTRCSRAGSATELVAYHSRTRRPAWRRTLPGSYCYEVTAERDAFSLLLGVGQKKGTRGEPARYQVTRLSARRGRTLSRRTVPEPRFNGVPRDVGPPLRAWFAQQLARNGGGYLDRTALVSRAGMVFVGIKGSERLDAAIYALDERTGRQLWRRPLLGIEGLAVQGTTLVAVYQRYPWETSRDRSGGGMVGIVALDTKTRKKLWEATVFDSSTN